MAWSAIYSKLPCRLSLVALYDTTETCIIIANSMTGSMNPARTLLQSNCECAGSLHIIPTILSISCECIHL